MTVHTAEELRREVHEAFARRPYPGDDAIARRRPGCPGYEAEEVWQRYRGKDWPQMVAAGGQRNLRDDLGFLTFEGFVYYLPAFLELSLDADRRFALGDGGVVLLRAIDATGSIRAAAERAGWSYRLPAGRREDPDRSRRALRASATRQSRLDPDVL